MRTFAPQPKSTQPTHSAILSTLTRAHAGQDHAGSIRNLQRMIGNQALQRLLQSNTDERNSVSTAASPDSGQHLARLPIRPLQAVVLQTKPVINQPGDAYEQEADQVADELMRMPEPQVQRTYACGEDCPSCPACSTAKPGLGDENLRIQRTAAREQGGSELPPIVHEVIRSPGQAMDLATRAFMEPRFGQDFSAVAIHTDDKAAASARAVDARAYTLGEHVVFGAGEYQPASAAGKRLLAHELTHVMQQSRSAGTLQRQQEPLTPRTSTAPPLRVGIIPVREFIRHVETVERAYPAKSPQEILTMIRSLYYGSPAGSPGFDRLIPDAPSTGAVEMCTDSEGRRCEAPVGVCVCVYAEGLAMDVEQLRSAVSRLRQHADENEIADNPSPYIEVGSELIDVGHLLVGVDAILHPRTEDPFRSHGLTSAPGPATWEGDVGAAMVYLAEHQANGHKSPDVKGNPSPTVESYYLNSAPMSDILGDVDAFGMASLVGPQTLSTALRYYYVSESGGSPRYQYNRWAGFCSRVGLTYTQSGNTITWTAAARQLVIDRITAFANLFQGRTSPVTAMTLGITPRAWPEAGNFADRFLVDVKAGLEREIASHAAP